MMNKTNGPMMFPCGTPALIVAYFNCWSSLVWPSKWGTFSQQIMVIYFIKRITNRILH